MNKMVIKNALLVFLMLGLVGCATYSGSSQTRSPAPVVEAPVIDGRTLPAPDQQQIKREPLSNIPSVSPAVSNLVAKASAYTDAGEFDKAAGQIERALRLKPRDATLWSRLAEIRYLQKNWAQAAQLAARSNAMPSLPNDVKRRNWWMMSQSYEALGDQQNANKYSALLSR